MATVADAILKIRKIINEPTASIWKDADIIDWYAEAMRRIKVGSKLLSGITIPTLKTDTVIIHDDFIDLPNLFAAARCFDQDQQYYEGAKAMNEFETKRLEYIDWIEENPDQAILPTGKVYTDAEYQPEYVTDIYSDGTYGDPETDNDDDKFGS